MAVLVSAAGATFSASMVGRVFKVSEHLGVTIKSWLSVIDEYRLRRL